MSASKAQFKGLNTDEPEF